MPYNQDYTEEKQRSKGKPSKAYKQARDNKRKQE